MTDLTDKLTICVGAKVCELANKCLHSKTHILRHILDDHPFGTRTCWDIKNSACIRLYDNHSYRFSCVEYTPEVYAQLPTKFNDYFIEYFADRLVKDIKKKADRGRNGWNIRPPRRRENIEEDAQQEVPGGDQYRGIEYDMPDWLAEPVQQAEVENRFFGEEYFRFDYPDPPQPRIIIPNLGPEMGRLGVGGRRQAGVGAYGPNDEAVLRDMDHILEDMMDEEGERQLGDQNGN